MIMNSGAEDYHFKRYDTFAKRYCDKWEALKIFLFSMAVSLALLIFLVGMYFGTACKSSQTVCSSDRSCISKEQTCNGLYECRNGEDEAECDPILFKGSLGVQTEANIPSSLLLYNNKIKKYEDTLQQIFQQTELYSTMDSIKVTSFKNINGELGVDFTLFFIPQIMKLRHFSPLYIKNLLKYEIKNRANQQIQEMKIDPESITIRAVIPAHKGCVKVECEEICSNGFVQDTKGCPTCNCLTRDLAICPLVTCAIYCENGYRRENNDCKLCVCS